MDARFVAPTVKTATPFHIILPVQDDGRRRCSLIAGPL
ncbi:Hypothetical protein AKI40_3778 [Enterobacter sp. FY-07]|nr:Hypothetical protein AKI40_3778 [Enterobacter sp. FY-07]